MRVALAVMTALAVLSLPAPAAAERLADTIPVGSKPFGVAVDAVAGRVYVSNQASGTVSVLDAATHAVLATVPVGPGPGALALDPSRQRLWVSNASGPNISVVDTAKNEVVATIAAGGLGIGVDPELGRVYATNGKNLSVIDADEDEVLAIMPAANFGDWWGLAVNAATHRVYVADLHNEALVVLDGATYDLIAATPMRNPSRFGVAVDHTTNRVYVATYPRDEALTEWPLRVLDGATNEVVDSLAVPSFSLGVALDTDRQRAYVTNTPLGSVRVIDLSAKTVVADVPVGSEPAGIAVDPAREQVFVANRASDTVSVLGPNAAPVLVSVTLTPAEPRTNDIVTVSLVASDRDGDRLSYRYQWSRNGEDIEDAAGPTLDLSVAGRGDRGDRIAVRVTVLDGTVTTGPVVRSVVVANSAPAVDAALEPTAPRTNDTLSVTAIAHDPDGDSFTLGFQWLRNGAPIAGATDATLDLAGAGHGDKADHIGVRVLAVDDSLAVAPVTTAPVVVANTPPLATVTLSATTPGTHDVLVATVTASDTDGDAVTFTYFWRVNGVLRRTTVTGSFTDRLDLAGRGNGDDGDEIFLEVQPADAELSGLPTTASALVTAGPR